MDTQETDPIIQMVQDLVSEVSLLRKERDEAREIARLAVVAWWANQESGHPPGCGYDEGEIQELRSAHPWLKEKE